MFCLQMAFGKGDWHVLTYSHCELMSRVMIHIWVGFVKDEVRWGLVFGKFEVRLAWQGMAMEGG